MFMLLRSAVCIGLVVAAVPDRPGAAPVAEGPALVAAAAGLARTCGSNPALCRRAVDAALTAAHDTDTAAGRKRRPRLEAAPHVSRDAAAFSTGRPVL